MDKEQALKKLKKYCAYQERCHLEIRTKLISIEVYGDMLEEIIVELINEGFLDEERFARSYARGKFRMKKWGRNRIIQELSRRNISDYCIKKGMEEIEEDEYEKVLKAIIIDKLSKSTDKDSLIAKDLAIKYASKKGFEPVEIFKIIRELELNSNNLF